MKTGKVIMASTDGTFDPYHRWLGIPPNEQPANLYRLLGLSLFEADPNVIESAADRQMAHVRSFAGGPHSAVSQRLLNEITAAKLCLLNQTKKAAYDRSVRQVSTSPAPSLPPSPPAMAPMSAPRVAPYLPPMQMPVAQVAQVAAPVPVSHVSTVADEPSRATERWRAIQRKRASSKRSMAWSIWIVAAMVPAAVFAYLEMQKHRTSQVTGARQSEVALQTARIEPREPKGDVSTPRVPSRPVATNPVDDERLQQEATVTPLRPSVREAIETPKEPPKLSVDEVAIGLDSQNPFERRTAVNALSGMNGSADEAVACLEKYVRREPDGELKIAAIDGMLRLKTNPQEAIDLLSEIVSGDTPANVQVISKKFSPALRRQALGKLGQIGPPASSASPVVLKIMKVAAKGTNHFHDVFCECADCLAMIGADRNDVVQALKSFTTGRGFPDKGFCVSECKAAAERALSDIERRAARGSALSQPPDAMRRRTLADP